MIVSIPLSNANTNTNHLTNTGQQLAEKVNNNNHVTNQLELDANQYCNLNYVADSASQVNGANSFGVSQSEASQINVPVIKQVNSTSTNLLMNDNGNSDFGTYFVNQLLPHVKSFAYTWFHLQAAKRKHFKNEDKRMNYDDELKLKQRLMNELPSVKIKWAVRLLMKLRKDIQKIYQNDLVDVICSSSSVDAYNQNAHACSNMSSSSKCVISNPDMKGKMRRIDCLRQSDKVWRLDLVMVVLFKGIPLESSDGERLDKLPECMQPQLCINPNHALLNVRDLEVYLANFINTSSNKKVNYNKNIVSPSVFTAQEFITLADVVIVQGASETELKNSVSNTSAHINSHYSDNENDEDQPVQTASRHHVNNIKEEQVEKNSQIILQIQNHHTNSINDQQNETLPYKRSLNHELNDESTLPKLPISNCDKPSDIQQANLLTAISMNGVPKPKKTKTTNKPISNDNIESAIMTSGLNGISVTNIVKTVKTNPKINEIIEQMQLNASSPLVNSINSQSITDFDLKIDGNAKKKKETKNDANQEAPSIGSPAKLTAKRRRSSQKSIEALSSNSNVKAANNLDNEPVAEQNVSASSNKKTSSTNPSTNRRKQLKTTTPRKKQTIEENESTLHPNNLNVIEDHSSCSTSSQQDEEIKELLMQKTSFQQIPTNNSGANVDMAFESQQQQPTSNYNNNSNNKQILMSRQSANTPNMNDADAIKKQINLLINSNTSNNKLNSPINDLAKQFVANNSRSGSCMNISPSNLVNLQQQNFNLNSTKIFAEELKELIQKEKQTTADLFLQLLKVQEDQMNSGNSPSSLSATNNNNQPANTHVNGQTQYMHQNSNSNSNDNIFSEFNSNTANMLLNGTHFMQQQQQQQQLSGNQQMNKSTTPVFVDQLLMSPLFTNFLPSSACSSASSASNSSTGSNSSSLTSNSTLTNNTQFNAAQFSQFAAAAMSAAINLNKTPSSSPITVIDSNNKSSFKKTKNKQGNSKNTKNSNSNSSNNSASNKLNNINISLISSLKFDNNSNGSLEDLLNAANQSLAESINNQVSAQQQQQNLINKINSYNNSLNNRPRSKIKSGKEDRSSQETRDTTSQVTKSDESVEKEVELTNAQIKQQQRSNEQRIQTPSNGCTSPPPPPSIGTSVLNGTSLSAPSPTQFFPYASYSSGHIMHRPIPILQKADAALSSLINNLTTSNNNLNQIRASPTNNKLDSTKPSENSNNINGKNLNFNENNKSNSGNKNSSNNNNNNNTNSTSLANKATCDLNELIKLQQQQQQLFSTLRSNSIISNSPLMFNHNCNTNNNASNNNSNSNGSNNFLTNYSSNSNGANMFSNYPNISPANTLNNGLIGGNGTGSPTSNLFPSITSLFQSPIGTPRVTPTPQHFAAYLFNEEQFHSLIFPSSSLSNTSQNCNDAFLDACNMLSSQSGNTNSMITNFVNNSELSNNLSPLPLFSNLISNSLTNINNTNSQQANAKTNSEPENANSISNNSNNTNNSSETKSNTNIILSINN